MTENQANSINTLFRNLKKDNKKQLATTDSLKSIVKVFDQDRVNYVQSLDKSHKLYMLSEEENKILLQTQQSLKIGRFAQDISVITLMFTVVILLKTSFDR
jgi:hypothetical protein